MSNEELIKKFYNAFKNKDMEIIHQICDEKIEWNTLKGMPHGGKYIGLKAIFDDYFTNMLSNFEEFHAIPETYLDAKNHMVVIGRYKGISKKKKKFDIPFSHIYEIKENRIVKFTQFTDTYKLQESI